MDVATHAIMASIVAAPWLESHPMCASGFILGSVIPDLDSISRLAGKRAFLYSHQTWTHSLPLILLTTGVLSVLAQLMKPELTGLFLWAGIGMVGHALLDASNTYGAKLLIPFSYKRRSTEWVFFIDSVVWCASLLSLLLLLCGYDKMVIASAYVGASAIYWIIKVLLRRTAVRLVGMECLAMIPSSLYPWIFHGARLENGSLVPFEVNLLRSSVKSENPMQIHDNVYKTVLETSENYQTMKDLSPLFFLVTVTKSNGEKHLLCSDLRIRNFNTKFGDLEIVLDSSNKIKSEVLHV